MTLIRTVGRWPVIRQMAGDPTARGEAARSPRTDRLRARIAGSDPTRSVCPYCAVGCGQLVYTDGGRVSHIEGDPDSPISRGRLCPKGAASAGLVNGTERELRVKYRRPGGTAWEHLDLDTAMDMIADRVIDARDRGWQESDAEGRRLRRTLGLANLGGATLDNEENYLIKKIMMAIGAVQVENQARI